MSLVESYDKFYCVKCVNIQHLSKVSFVVHLVVPDVTQPCLARQIPQVEHTNWTLLPPEARQDIVTTLYRDLALTGLMVHWANIQ